MDLEGCFFPEPGIFERELSWSLEGKEGLHWNRMDDPLRCRNLDH